MWTKVVPIEGFTSLIRGVHYNELVYNLTLINLIFFIIINFEMIINLNFETIGISHWSKILDKFWVCFEKLIFFNILIFGMYICIFCIFVILKLIFFVMYLIILPQLSDRQVMLLKAVDYFCRTYFIYLTQCITAFHF